MPKIQIDAADGGPIKINYHISTPIETSAPSADLSRPTILFIHGVFVAQETFIAQFNDPNLRRFNLVALDLRSHGSTEGDVPDDYGPQMAAKDVVLFMDALGIPPCHIFGLSMGTIVALQLAIDHPDRVLSLFLLSPLGLDEPQEVAEGRKAIHDAWVEGFSAEETDDDALFHAVGGALELVSKDRHSAVIEALLASTLPQAMINWNKQHLREYRITTLDFIIQRKARTKEELAKIKVPVKLLHCLGDVAYPAEVSASFLELLKDAGVDASLDTVPDASHFGCCEDADLINPILHNFIIANTNTEVPPSVEGVSSPWNVRHSHSLLC
ncbi:hypothetical protein GYMLUDRAFT_154015 [Collybiopsis luxurians FD-317 M1]|nr:hypothetical protein GYMLUDRAFT_154015 [Collybiopsis luxurians FD-317 M1]